MKKTTKHPEDMTLDELARATRKFDRPFLFEKARPMTAHERAHERKLRRPKARNGHQPRKISISLEGNVLRKADALAKKKGINRSILIADLVRNALIHSFP
jgi:hypothetical protein